jgi:hypothetical protein
MVNGEKDFNKASYFCNIDKKYKNLIDNIKNFNDKIDD